MDKAAMNQVKWANTCELWTETPDGPVYSCGQVDNQMIPVLPLAALQEVVEGLKKQASVEFESDDMSLDDLVTFRSALDRLLAGLGEGKR